MPVPPNRTKLMPDSTLRLDLMIGDLALKRGWVATERLAAVIAAQERMIQEGHSAIPLGALLIEAGDLTPNQLADLLADQAEALLREQDARFGAILVRKGLAPQEVVDRALADQVTSTRPLRLGDFLVERGLIDSQAIAASLTDQERLSAGLTTLAGAPLEMASPVAVATWFAGRYEVREELGFGGMGSVFRALDRQLSREVALKLLHLGPQADEESIARFQREAQAAAGLSHPGIIQVYDVGASEGKPYYVMELLHGIELSRAIQEKSLARRDAVEITRQVAEALRFAHARGVLHRDIKPRNVLLVPSGNKEAPWTAKLLDFGLAKFTEQALQMPAGEASGQSLRTLTHAGEMMGTPMYMSPEQFAGAQNVDARADLYSLGATFYELLTGRPPFEKSGTLAELMYQVRMTDPPSPRRSVPDLDRDLETICLKNLAKQAHERYASAGELADDLARWLEGEPIAARPVGWPGRLWRRALRHRRIASWAAGALALILGLSLYLGVVQRQHEKTLRAQRDQQERLQQQHRELVQKMLDDLAQSGELAVEAALAWRVVGDMHKQHSYEGKLAGPIEELKKQAPERAEPWFHQGRMLRVQGQDPQALECQEQAVARAQAEAAPEGSRALLGRALYERGVLRAARYLWALEEQRSQLLQGRARGTAGKSPEAPSNEEVEAQAPELIQMREQALVDLESVTKSARGTVDEGRESAALGLSAVLRGDLPEARKRFAEAQQRERYLEEIYLGMAALETSAGNWSEAARWYQQGHQVDRGYLPYLRGQAEAWLRTAEQDEKSGTGGAASWERAREAIDEGLKLDPERGELWTLRIWLGCGEGKALLRRGQDPAESWKQALLAAEKAFQLNPGSTSAANNQAVVYQAVGDARVARGEDATEMYQNALAAYQRALALNPRSALAFANQASVYRALGDARVARGEDATEWYEKALAGCERALALNPRFAQAANNQAVVYSKLADARRARGEDATELYRKALAGYDRALALEPSSADAANNQANVYQALGDASGARGEDATENYQRALAGYDRALALNPRYADAAYNQAMVYQSLGDARRARGEDATEIYQKALAGYDRAIALNPRLAEAPTNQAMVYQSLGDARRSRGEDAAEMYQKALAGCDRAISMNPSLWQSHATRGEALEALDRPEEAVAAYQAALRLAGNQAPDLRRMLARAQAESARRKDSPNWVKVAARAERALQQGDRSGARTLYEQALSEAGSQAESDPRLQGARAAAHYNLACLLALEAGALTTPAESAAALALRDRAFHELDEALLAGWNDPVHLAADPDLVPLQADSRWPELLERAKRGAH